MSFEESCESTGARVKFTERFSRNQLLRRTPQSYRRIKQMNGAVNIHHVHTMNY